MGNDFFEECGDCFSSFPIDNPDEKSEELLLRAYAPTVNSDTLRSLTGLFADLRALVDDGLLSYPYSLREIVNIVRHLDKYGTDGLLYAASVCYLDYII